jgi:hypothetical protein
MKDFMVGFNYSEFAKVQIRAESREEAESIVYKMLEDYGMPDNAKIFDRDYSVDCAVNIDRD